MFAVTNSDSLRSGFLPAMLGATLTAITCALPAAKASNFITFTFTAQITSDSSLAGSSLPPDIVVGDTISGYYTVDLDEMDVVGMASTVGFYHHVVGPASLYAKVRDAVFQTNPSVVIVDVSIVDGITDVYSVKSGVNVANMGITMPTTFDFQLQDSSGAAVTNDDQPTSPPNLGAFDSYTDDTGTRLLIQASGDYKIVAEILSVNFNYIVDDDGFATDADCDAPSAVCFLTIQSAIDALGAGSTIKVCPGLYTEDLEFPMGADGIHLMAEDPAPANTIIQGVANVDSGDFPLVDPNIHILANDIDIGGFTIRGPDPVAGRYSSGMVIGGDNAHIHDNVFEVTNAATLDDISQGLQTYRDGVNPTGGNVDGLLVENNTFTHHGAGSAGYEAIFINHVSSDPAPADKVTVQGNTLSGKLIRGITSARSKTDILDNEISTDLAPQSGALDVGESLQGVNIVDSSNRDQQEVNVLRNVIGATGASPMAPTLIITGVIDGDNTGGLPKAVELYATGDIADLSDFGLGCANNGGGSDGEEFTFSGSASEGQFIYVTSDSAGFMSFFGFAPDFTSGGPSGAASVNGDDAIELFKNGSVIDVFGDINVDGTGQPWEYMDGWAYRKSVTGPDGNSFVLANWNFSGVNALDGETTNGAASIPFPTASYTAGGAFGQAVRLGNDGAPAQTLTSIVVEENFINGNAGGVSIRSSADGVTIFNNDLGGNADYGVDNLDSELLDASGNWWGDNDSVIVGTSVGVGAVDYTPWLASGTDTGGGVGFQGDFSELYVDDDSPQPTGYGRIQEGVDLVTASTVHVLAGTYIEQVYVYKSVELLGANAGVNPNTGVRGPESILWVDESGPDPDAAPYPSHFYVDADDVLIDGFLMDGDNPNLDSGEITMGPAIDAEQAIAAYGGVGDITIQNNIIKNTSYTGVDFYNFYDDTATANNYIRDNRFENLGVSEIPWGIAVLIYNNFYAEITDNVIINARVGVQTGNFYKANPGSTASISNNEISARRRGIFYNLHYSNATPFVVSDNDITGVDDPDAPMGAQWQGMLISSQQSAVDADFIDNDVDGSAVTSIPSSGISAWNTPTTSDLTIEGGHISGVQYGIWVNNYEGYNSNAHDTRLFVDHTTITATDIGAYILDSLSNTNGATVFANLSNNTDISGASIAGVVVEGDDASAVLVNNLASISGNTVGVQVDKGTALLERNNLSGNSSIGLHVLNHGLVDAGDVDGGNVTGLGAGTGPNGSSMGCNFLAGYDGVTSLAVDDDNLISDGDVDVQADANFWGTQNPVEIETVVEHVFDDPTPTHTEVFFSDPKSVPQLIISAPDMCLNNGPSQIQVTLSMANLPITVTGYFARIQYDPAVLTLVPGLSHYDYDAGFPNHFNSALEDEDPMTPTGFVRVDASAAPMSSGTDQNQQLATLTFNVIGCGQTSIGFGPPPGPSILSQVSFEGIGLTTELIEDSALIDIGGAPAPAGPVVVEGEMANSSCEGVVTLSATIADDCCMDLTNGASVSGNVAVISGNATLGTPTFNVVQGASPTQVVVTASVPVMLNGGCSAEVEFSLNAMDCCGNAMATVPASAIVQDLTPPVFLNSTHSLDITIECDESTEPGILLGTTDPSSGIAVYYNDNGDGEDGNANVAYMQMQAAYANTNGAPFAFSSAPLSGNGVNWAYLFGQVPTTQYGLDMVLRAPTFDGSVTIPALLAWENTDNTLGGSMADGSVTWAINDYKGGSPNGPANPATSVIHSLFRSATGTPSVDVQDVAINLSLSGTVYTADISGKLVSDNTIHWYTIGTPDSAMMDYSLDGEFFFSGTLSYDSAGDSGMDLVDFYQGPITVSANSPNVSLGFPLANDNCSAVPSLSYSDTIMPDGCNSIINRTWTATDDCGNQSTFLQVIHVVDTTAPVVEQPADIEVPADAGSGCQAYVTVPPLVATDNCGIQSIVNNKTMTDDASDMYPLGTTTVMWTVMDNCGNHTEVTQDITVLDENIVNVVVELTDLKHNGTATPFVFSRNIRFVLNNGSNCSNDICETAVTFSGAFGQTPTAMVSITAPCDTWMSVCAKDDHVTVYDNVDLSVVGTAYVGDFNLKLHSGDTDNDGDIDINDVTYLLFAFGSSGAVPDACPYDGVRTADFSLNAAVAGEDYSILQGNWLLFTACNCALPFSGPDVEDLGPDGVDLRPIDGDAVSFSKRARGKRVLRLRTSEVSRSVADVVDVNRDGIIDDQDVRAFEIEFGLPSTLSRKIRQSVTDLARHGSVVPSASDTRQLPQRK